jgi:hypothetical protein
MIRSAARVVLAAVLVVSAFWNIVRFDRISAESVPGRSENVIVVEEKRLAGVRMKLLEVGYGPGQISFVTGRDLAANPRTAADDYKWAIARYALIPWVLVRDTRDTPYVIADYGDTNVVQEIGADFIKIYDGGNGVVLFRKNNP